MSNPRSSYNIGLAYLVFTACGWGIGWTVFKSILHDWTPLFARGVAGLVAALGLAIFAMASGKSMRVPRALYGRLAFAAIVNVFVWMGFTALTLNWLRVSEATILTFTMPMWATLLAWPILGEKPGTRDAVALALGFAGIVLLVAEPDLSVSSAKLPGIAFALSAAALFAFGSVTARSPLPFPPIVATAWQVGLGCLPMVVLGLLFEHPNIAALSGRSAIGLAYMAIVPMALCYLAWFATLRRLPAGTAATGMLLVPVVATVSAAIALGEPLHLKELTAMVLTLGGVALALRKQGAVENTVPEATI